MVQGCSLAFFDENHHCIKYNSDRVSPIIQANFGCTKIPNNEFHNSHTQSPITATKHFPQPRVSTVNPNIIDSQHIPSCMNMTHVIIIYTLHQNETQNFSNKHHIITHPSTLQSARKTPTHIANHWATVQPEHCIPTTTNFQLGSYPNTSSWPKSLQRKDSQFDCARIAKPHPLHPHRFAHNWQREQ